MTFSISLYVRTRIPTATSIPFRRRRVVKYHPPITCTTQLLPLSSRALISVTGPPVIAFPNLFPSIFFPSASPLAFHFFRCIPLFWKQEHFPLFPSFFYLSSGQKLFGVHLYLQEWNKNRKREWKMERAEGKKMREGERQRVREALTLTR